MALLYPSKNIAYDSGTASSVLKRASTIMKGSKVKVPRIICAIVVLAFVQQLHAYEPINPAEISAFATEAGVLEGLAVACGFPQDQIRNYEKVVLDFAKGAWPNGGGRVFVESFNAALRTKRPTPDWMTCQSEIKHKFFMANNDPSFLRTMYNSKTESVKSNIQPLIGMNVCRQVSADIQILGDPTTVLVDVRGFVDQISGNRMKVIITSLMANVGVRKESLREITPIYTKGLPAWESRDAWHEC